MTGVEPEVTEQTPPAPPKGKEPETVTLTKAEVESLRRERDEARESERYWSERARRGAAEPEPEVEEPESDIDVSDLLPKTGDKDVDDEIFRDPDKWADAISKGPQAIEKFVRKMGFVSAAEAADIAAKVARRTVDVERQKITSDNEIVREFPDLQDKESDLFKETARRFQKLVKLDPRAAKTPTTLYAAAEAAREVLKARAPKPAPRDDDDVYDRYGDDDRRSRADAQGAGQNGRRGGAPVEEDDMLGPEAKAICKQMGISEEDFLKSQRDLGTRRRGKR